jgi:hypothetical protein
MVLTYSACKLLIRISSGFGIQCSGNTCFRSIGISPAKYKLVINLGALRCRFYSLALTPLTSIRDPSVGPQLDDAGPTAAWVEQSSRFVPVAELICTKAASAASFRTFRGEFDCRGFSQKSCEIWIARSADAPESFSLRQVAVIRLKALNKKR